jgi:hypothetical protein
MAPEPHTSMPIETWIERFRSLAQGGLPAGFLSFPRAQPATPGSPSEAVSAWIAAFRDGEGHRRAVDGPLLSHMLGVMPPAATSKATGKASPEASAWMAVAQRDRAGLAIDIDADGRLYPHLASEGLEWWTEAELASLQALAWIGLRERSARVLDRVTRAAAWLVREVQPDNATQRPWAAGFFVVRSMDPALSDRERQETSLYAQTLVENALVGREALDAFSACVLWDSAAWLEALHRSAWSDAPACVRTAVHTK